MVGKEKRWSVGRNGVISKIDSAEVFEERSFNSLVGALGNVVKAKEYLTIADLEFAVSDRFFEEHEINKNVLDDFFFALRDSRFYEGDLTLSYLEYY